MLLVDCVRQGFKYALQNKKGCELVNNDLKLIFPAAKKEEEISFNYRGETLKMDVMPEYVDERAIKDLELYDKYFSPFKAQR